MPGPFPAFPMTKREMALGTRLLCLHLPEVLRVQFLLSRKQYTSAWQVPLREQFVLSGCVISRVQFVISRKIADTKTLGIDTQIKYIQIWNSREQLGILYGACAKFSAQSLGRGSEIQYGGV